MLVVATLLALAAAVRGEYLVGAGRADITGPAAQVNMMGYAMPGQTTKGIHTRLYSRAFIIGETTPGGKRACFVSIDACMGSQIMRMNVLTKLQTLYGPLYNTDNLIISGIHTHSGPAGYFQYVLFEITSLGFVKESLDAIVDGIVLSIQRAHDNLTPGSITAAHGELLDASVNRSPSAYLNNPAEERARYQYNTDKNVTQLRIRASNGTDMGAINWFAVHCTSMNNNNSLISSDNKGYASAMFEREMNSAPRDPNVAPFVAAFAQSNEGDVSPNTDGAKCIKGPQVNMPCDFNSSTCLDDKGKARVELCMARGPGGMDDALSTKIIGQKQLDKAKTLFASATEEVTGPIDYRHQFIEMGEAQVQLSNGTWRKTCVPSMGDSFAAGTTDGPGAFDFKQGDATGNPFWDAVGHLLKKPSKEQTECQHPKPIFLDTGEIKVPYEWQAHVVDVQVVRIGQLFIIAVPSEFTTMAGRRTRDAVAAVVRANGIPSDLVVIAGLSNTYSDYTTTFEEYQIQRYEGASTAHGPFTHLAYTQALVNITKDMFAGVPSNPGPEPPHDQSKQVSFLPPVLEDSTPSGVKFGDMVEQPSASYTVGQTVTAVFWSANPRNNVRLEGTFLTVERQASAGAPWQVVYTDADWETRYRWEGKMLSSHSHANITWDIPADYKGVGLSHRIQHFGTSKALGGRLSDFAGTSSTFTVTAAPFAIANNANDDLSLPFHHNDDNVDVTIDGEVKLVLF